jgi:hypothetical protein
MTACQESKSSNEYISSCQNSKINYPLKTGQKDIFTYKDINQNKSYYDDGFTQYGQERNFVRSSNNIVNDFVYHLQWQDDIVIQEDNISMAEEYCATLTLNNFGDWRLPNMYELITLINIGASTNSRESSFNNMPYGAYYSSNILTQASKVAMINFDANDFNISWESFELEKSSIYGVLISENNEPYFNNDGFLVSVQNTKTYQNDENTTEIVKYSQYDTKSGLLLSENSFKNVKPNDFGIIPAVPNADRYVKCVRGDELDMGHFKRDDEKEIVLDTQAGLMWQDNLDVVNVQIQWGKSIEYCKSLDLGGYKDWRMPTITELASIVNYRAESSFVLHDSFRYNCACKYHSTSNSCYDIGFGTCEQSNYQLNTCGALPQRIEKNNRIDESFYDNNDSEPYYRIRCVRCGYKAE